MPFCTYNGSIEKSTDSMNSVPFYLVFKHLFYYSVLVIGFQQVLYVYWALFCLELSGPHGSQGLAVSQVEMISSISLNKIAKPPFPPSFSRTLLVWMLFLLKLSTKGFCTIFHFKNSFLSTLLYLWPLQ